MELTWVEFEIVQQKPLSALDFSTFWLENSNSMHVTRFRDKTVDIVGH